MNKRHCFAFLLCLSLMLLGQSSSLDTIKKAVQFEIEQKSHLKLSAARLHDEYVLLSRMQVDDAQILRVLKLSASLSRYIQQLDDANARQATLAEQLKRSAADEHLSQQEDRVYRQCSLTLTELGHVQGKLHQLASRQQRSLKLFLLRLPPPASFTLADGLSFTLIKQDRQSFYVSQPLSSTLPGLAKAQVPAAALKTSHLTPNRHDAQRVAEVLSRHYGVSLSLPTQDQLEAMCTSKFIPPLAVWSRDLFHFRNSLTYSRLRDTPIKLSKLELTPAQQNSTARFKIPFYLIWDPQRQFGAHDFTRELPHAIHAQLGMVLTAPSSVGAKLRLDALTRQFKDDMIKDLQQDLQK